MAAKDYVDSRVRKQVLGKCLRQKADEWMFRAGGREKGGASRRRVAKGGFLFEVMFVYIYEHTKNH